MSADDTAAEIVNGVLGHRDMPFSQFRQKMIDLHPEYLTDEEIHRLYQAHVTEVPEVTAAEQIVARLDALTQGQHETNLDEARQRVAERVAKHEQAVAEAARRAKGAQRSKKRHKKKKWWSR